MLVNFECQFDKSPGEEDLDEDLSRSSLLGGVPVGRASGSAIIGKTEAEYG